MDIKDVKDVLNGNVKNEIAVNGNYHFVYSLNVCRNSSSAARCWVELFLSVPATKAMGKKVNYTDWNSQGDILPRLHVSTRGGTTKMTDNNRNAHEWMNNLSNIQFSSFGLCTGNSFPYLIIIFTDKSSKRTL